MFMQYKSFSTLLIVFADKFAVACLGLQLIVQSAYVEFDDSGNR